MTVYFKAFSIFTFFEIWAQNIFSKWRHSCTAIRTIGLFLPASGFCAGQFQLEGALFRLLCHAWRESKVREKNGGANSKVSEAREKRDRNPISHSVSFANTANPSPMKTWNPAPARNFNSRFPPKFWPRIPNITAKKCWIPHPAKPIGDPLLLVYVIFLNFAVCLTVLSSVFSSMCMGSIQLQTEILLLYRRDSRSSEQNHDVKNHPNDSPFHLLSNCVEQHTCARI